MYYTGLPMTNEAYWQVVLPMTDAWKLGMNKARRAIEIAKYSSVYYL